MKAEHIEGIVENVRTILTEAVERNDAVSVSIEQGVHYVENYDKGYREGYPNGTTSFKIEINGGATDDGAVPPAALTANL